MNLAKILCCTLVLGALSVNCSFAAIRLVAPSSAGKGNAFVAEARSDIPTDQFRFLWRGGAYNAKAHHDENGEWIAQILLPVPLNE